MMGCPSDSPKLEDLDQGENQHDESSLVHCTQHYIAHCVHTSAMVAIWTVHRNTCAP